MNSCILEDFEEIYEDDIENENFEISIKELEPIIKKNIKNYFLGKNLHNGQKITEDLLELPYYSSLIMKTSASNGVLKAYELMQDNFFMQGDNNSIGEDIKYMIYLIRNIQKCVPQELVGGMILMHLELIEGIEICQIC